MPMVAARIRDGYTMVDVFKPTRPTIYTGVEIKYRPALQAEVLDFLADPRKHQDKSRDLILKNLISWNVAGEEDDKPAPITLDVVKELAYPVLDWMCDCILGYAPKREAEDAKN